MKKTALLFLILSMGLVTFAQEQAKPQWTKVLSDQPETFQTQLLSSSENSIQVNIQVPGFYTTTVNTPNGEANIISVPKSVSTAEAGEPNMPMTGIPVIIGDKARMKARVIDAQYMDFKGIEVAPSKGEFPRTIDPATVPYTYGDCYRRDAFFPASNLNLYEPYIIRDFRGQNMAVYPFAYNPVSKTLRVYYNMTVEMYKVDNKGENVIESRRSNEVKMDPDFKSVYQRHFINFEAGMAKYTPVDEEGDLLIICYDNFISSMTDFVNWKKTRGVNTTIVGTSTAGSSYSAIKTYIQNQYNANNNLTHVLLVGDVAQIPGYPYTAGGTGSSGYDGKSDNIFGQVVGSDIYNDLFIGRFSAQNAAQVATQVQRTITYERDLNTSATWLKKGEGIAAYAGSNGHFNEDDYEHMNNIRTDLTGYGYSTVYQDYENVSGYSCSASIISSHFNSGVGIGNYTNHGNVQMWGVANYSNTQVNALTNENKLPFIFSVACLVGKYDNTETSYGSGTTVGQTNDCFAEAWMHATNSAKTQPTGAIGGMFSYISQPWEPPMYGHDEMIDILVESYSSNIKRTLGGVSINGNMKVLDQYGSSSNPAKGTYQAWILYGDPTLMLRTNTPQAMTVTHEGVLPMGSTSYTLQVSNGNGALATITDASHNILGRATVSNDAATINIAGTLTPDTQLTLCVFGYNKETHLSTINVVGGTQYTITASVNPTEAGTVSGAGVYYESTHCTLTATSNTGYDFTNWTKNGTQVSTNPSYTFTVTEDANYTANFRVLTQHTVTCTATENGSIVASPTLAYKNEIITLTANPDAGFFLGSWIVTDGNNNSITVTNNQFVMPDSPVTVSATFVPGYTVTLASVMNGSISANPTHCSAGTTVALTATPATGYVFDSWVVYKTGDVNTTVAVSGNSFTMPTYDVTVAAIFSKPQGGETTIGSGTSNSNFVPTGDYYKYSLTQQIYTASELGTAGTITAISFYYNTSTSSNPRSLQIYMSHTSNSTITSWSTVSTSQRVFSGTITFTQGWNTITLTTPFAYNGTSNMLLTVDDNTGSWTTNSQFYSYSTGANRAIYYRNDSTNPDPTGSVSVTATSLQVNAQMKVTKEVPSNDPYLSVSSATLTGFTYPEEEGPSEAQTLAVIGRNIQNSLTVTAPADYEVSNNGNSFASTLSINPSNGSVQAMVYVRLKEGLTEGNYNGENLTFTSGTTTQGVSLNGEVTPGVGVNFYFITTTASPADAGTVTGAGRYREGSTATLTATANTGYTFTKWTKGGVQVSTEATYSFTVTEGADYVAVFTINSYEVVVMANPPEGGTITGEGIYTHGESCTVTATANTGYTFTKWIKNGFEVSTDATYTYTVTEAAAFIAVFTINSYNITATADPANGGTITGTGSHNYGTTATLVATANDEFLFEGWFENGNALSTENTLSFTVENDRHLVARFIPLSHQTQTFNIGWGWISFYVDLNGRNGLQLLEQAFGENGFMIKSHNDGFVQYENGIWSGTLNTIEVEQMYQINASGNGTLNLDAVAVDPADHPITLHNGWNWIGYPSPVETTVANAFNAFNGQEGDILKSHDAMATYINGYGWWGTLGKMTPGCGYMYNYMGTDDNTFVYSQGARGTEMHTANNDNLHWNAVAADFSNNASIIAAIDATDFTLSENTELGAFVDGECRGTTRLLYVEPLNQYLAFLTVFGNDGEQINFRIYDSGNSYPLEEQLNYQNNLVAGSAQQPVVLHQGASNGLVLYPNPVKAGEEVHINLSETLTVEIIDAMGRVIMHGDTMHCVSTRGMEPGFYTVRVTNEKGKTWHEKLIVR